MPYIYIHYHILQGKLNFVRLRGYQSLHDELKRYVVCRLAFRSRTYYSMSGGRGEEDVYSGYARVKILDLPVKTKSYPLSAFNAIHLTPRRVNKMR